MYSVADLCLIDDHNHQEEVSGTYKIFLLCLNNFLYLLKMNIQKWNCRGKYARKKLYKNNYRNVICNRQNVQKPECPLTDK